jgi:hypothetical protein
MNWIPARELMHSSRCTGASCWRRREPLRPGAKVRAPGRHSVRRAPFVEHLSQTASV